MSTDTEELKSLTRDSKTHSELITNQIINNSSYNSELLDIKFQNLDIICDWVSTWSNLRDGGVTTMSVDKYLQVMDLNPIQKAGELAGKDYGSHDWKIDDENINIIFSIDIICKFVLPTGEKINGEMEFEIKSFEDISKINNLINYKNNKNVNININDDSEFNVEFDKYIYTFKKVNKKFSYDTDEKYLTEIIEYAKIGKKWAECEIEELKYDEDYIYLPVNINEEQILFKFDMEDTDSNLWDLASMFDYDDPIMLEGEKMYISLDICTGRDSIYDLNNNMWSLKKEHSESSGLLNLFLDLIKNAFK